MPSTTQTPVRAYAHCVQSRCPGNAQEGVDALAVETFYSFQDTGGDGMFAHPERSTLALRFADVDESKCQYCGSNRDLSSEPRLQLDDSGYDRMALLDIAPEERYDPKTQADVASALRAEEDSKRDGEIRELREANAEMRGMMQALLAQSTPAPIPEPEDE